MKKNKTKKYRMHIICDKEITTDAIQLFKFENNIKFKEITTGGSITEIKLEMEK